MELARGQGDESEIAASSQEQGIWRRAADDTRRIGLSFAFLAAEVAATGAAGAIGALVVADPNASTADKVVVAGASAVSGFAALLVLVGVWSLLRAPFRQRDEARRAVAQLRKEAHPEFPRHAMKLGSLWTAEVTGPYPTRVIFVPLDYTNRERDRRVSLDFELTWFRDIQGQRLGPYALRPYAFPTIRDALTLPLSVAPESTVRGELVMEALMDMAFDYEDEGHGVAVKNGFVVSLKATDHVTGAEIERLIESRSIEPDDRGAHEQG